MTLLRNSLLLLAAMLLLATHCHAADIELYSIQVGPGSGKVFKYRPNKEVTVAMAIARAGYAGRYCSFIGTITEEEDAKQTALKESALKKLGLSKEEYEALSGT